MSRSYRIAIACGAAPLIVGTTIFALWLVTRWQALMVVGAWTLVVGLVAVIAGGCALERHCSRDGKRTGASRTSVIRAAALLLVNFPIAAAIVVAAWAIETAYVVVVHNASTVALRGVQLCGPGDDVRIGTLPAGATVTRWLWFHGDGELTLQSSEGPTPARQVVEGYVTHSLGGRATVTIEADGRIRVSMQK